MKFYFEEKVYISKKRGSCAFYIKTKNNVGIKVWFKSKAKNESELKNSYAWKNAKKEFKLLSKIKNSGLTPIPFKLTFLKSPDNQYLYPAILMENIVGKTLSDIFYRNPEKTFIFNEKKCNAHILSKELDSSLKVLGIAHNDIHFGNILIGKNSIKVIDLNLAQETK